jgi:hypothetical protein
MTSRTVLFGAFDRHNFGDMLFPHVAAALLGGKTALFAGVVERDLGPVGGHRTAALHSLARELESASVNLIHVGGEILTCDAWQVAVMALPPDQARRAIAAHDGDAAGRLAWGHRQLQRQRLAPYVAEKGLFSHPRAWVFCGVGGVEWADVPSDFRAEVLEVLKQADYLSVRDRFTQVLLAEEGIAAKRVPDPAVMVEELFGDQVRQRLKSGEVAQARAAFPQGYVAVQFSADFGDDATLAVLAEQLDRVASERGLGLVFFRAGAAPWHDDLEPYRRLIPRLRHGAGRVFESLDLWDICALIAGSRGYCGSSLHGRIVAAAFALPRLNIVHPGPSAKPGKQEAYARTWEEGYLGVTAVEGVAEGMELALATEEADRVRSAERLRALYRQGAAEWMALLA